MWKIKDLKVFGAENKGSENNHGISGVLTIREKIIRSPKNFTREIKGVRFDFVAYPGTGCGEPCIGNGVILNHLDGIINYSNFAIKGMHLSSLT